MYRTAMLLAAGVFLSAAACTHRQGAAGDAASPASERPVRLRVRSHYGLPVDMYALAGGAEFRLGTVAPGIERSFVVPKAALADGPVDFEARPAGTEPPQRSGRLVLAPGDVVLFEISATMLINVTSVRH